MLNNITLVGQDWLREQVNNMLDEVILILPSEFSEKYRILPRSVTKMPGPMRWDVNPFMREIVDCFDIDSPVCEVNLKKGVQITYTTLLESIILYYVGYVKTLPIMFLTADKELSQIRVDNNIIPMFNQSGFEDIFESSDPKNKKKTGKTKKLLQFKGGASLIPEGANNANKMRMHSIAIMLKDEIDAWPDVIGKDGDPDKLTDDRCAAYWQTRKICRGSTPLLKGSSKIQFQYERGDQRKYFVRCVKCGFAQPLRWEGINQETGLVYGIRWEYDSDGLLDIDSVRYVCCECGHGHTEYDKVKLFDPNHGAEWRPTAKPKLPHIRSYHLPALYSPVGMQPWYKSVADWLDAFDPVEKRVRNYGKLQVFYNNVLAEPFEVYGSRVTFVMASAHRRMSYRLGEVPQDFARKFAGGPIRLLTCQVDVHHSNIAVAVMGWTKTRQCFLIDYWRFTDDSKEGCESPDSPVWRELAAILEGKKYAGDIQVSLALIDAGWVPDTVCKFCARYPSGVYPILGRSKPPKASSVKEFSEFQTQIGTYGYKIIVDHYKDRIAPVLRRDWVEAQGTQKEYHFNAPMDVTDKQLKELTVEVRREEKDPQGISVWRWHRPGNAPNELWDLLVYGHAAVEIFAWEVCTIAAQMGVVDWEYFWEQIGNA